jgi:hypothetical protein
MSDGTRSRTMSGTCGTDRQWKPHNRVPCLPPRVAATQQPWATMHNAFGVRVCQFPVRTPKVFCTIARGCPLLATPGGSHLDLRSAGNPPPAAQGSRYAATLGYDAQRLRRKEPLEANHPDA